jgi:exodeoxyribonuclease V gamma subunit
MSRVRGILRPVIRVCTSHRTEVLLEAFVQNLVDERARMGPLAPVRVVVPNRNVETFLRLKIAERCGIAANLETTFLRRFLVDIVESAVPDARVAGVTQVEGHLLALLHDDAVLAEPSLAQVRAYLAAAGADRDALDRRRCQLAALLAQLFDEYAGSRSEMLAAWASDAGDVPFGDGRGLSFWQRALWRAVFGAGGRLARLAPATGIRTLPIDVLWTEAMARGPTPFAGKTVHVFGLSYIAAAYHHMLAALARASTVHIYTLSPCREEASDLLAKPDLSADDPFGLGREAQPALRRWARPGRENLRLLATCEGATVDARFPESPGDRATLLRRLQDDIVNRRVPGLTADQGERREPDGSLRVLPCPSLRRELEVVAAEIWNLVRKDASLRLCDVAVIVPEASKELYLAQLSAVFGESSDLPHSVADLPAASAHRVAEAIVLLLRLPFSTFTRKEFLPLVTHPCLMARFPEAAPETWRKLAHALGIVRGADRGDLRGSYVTRDLFTWDQGLRRLALGALCDALGPDEAEPVVLAGESYLPGPAIDGADEECLGFGLLVRSLIADARFASGGDKTPELALGQWLDFIRGLVESYLVLDADDGAGKAVIAHFLAELEGLSDVGLGQQPVSYRVAAELAERALSTTPVSRGHYLSSGVTVASFVPMRAIPFRAVFVLGLGQDAFPRPAGHHELDLRAGGRKAGDVDRREQDLYMFLETLLSTRDHLTLSYVARDEITGDEVPCSPVLLELRTMLGQGYQDPATLALLFGDDPKARPSLRRYDDVAERRAVLPAAESEHAAKELGAALARNGLSARTAPTPPAKAQTASTNDARDDLVIPLSALRRFLEDPLQGSARFRLGMHDDDDRAPADVEDEPFDLDRRASSWLLRASMTDALVAAQAIPPWQDLLAAYHRRASHAELGGQFPTGLFRSAGTQFETELLRAWQEAMPEILGQGHVECRVARLVKQVGQGLARGRMAGIVYYPAPGFDISLPGAADRRALHVRIGGETRLSTKSDKAGGATLGFTCRAGISDAEVCREDLWAFLDYVVLTAAGSEAACPGHRGALFYSQEGKGKLRTLGFGSLERTRAREYLARLCADLLTGALDVHGAATGVHPYLLPYEAVLASRRKKTALPDEIDDLCAEAESKGRSMSSLQGPVSRVFDRYAPPTAKEADTMAQARFGLFFKLALEDSA